MTLSAPVEANGLERRIKITIPTDQINEKVSTRLREIAPKVKLDGFRPGKIPVHVIEQRFGQSIWQEVLYEMIEKTLKQTLEKVELNPVDTPEIDFPKAPKRGEPVDYTAIFEVSPAIDLTGLSSLSIEKPVVSITDKQVEETIEKLREQHADWTLVERASKEGDQVTIDFEGFLNGVAFPGGEAKNFKLHLGSKRMIPGFEEAIVGIKPQEEKTIEVTFPDEYHAKDLAGKKATFKIKAHEVAEPKLPEVDEKFAEKLGVKEGGIEGLKTEIKKRLEKETEHYAKQIMRKNLLNALKEKFHIELPQRLLKKEMHKMAHAAHYHPDEEDEEEDDHHDHHCDHDHEITPEIEEQAKERIAMQLLFFSYIEKHKIVTNEDLVKQEIEGIAQDFQYPEQIVRWYYTQENLLNNIRSRVFEDQVFEHMLGQIKVVEKNVTQEELGKM